LGDQVIHKKTVPNALSVNVSEEISQEPKLSEATKKIDDKFLTQQLITMNIFLPKT